MSDPFLASVEGLDLYTFEGGDSWLQGELSK